MRAVIDAFRSEMQRLGWGEGGRVGIDGAIDLLRLLGCVVDSPLSRVGWALCLTILVLALPHDDSGNLNEPT